MCRWCKKETGKSLCKECYNDLVFYERNIDRIPLLSVDKLQRLDNILSRLQEAPHLITVSLWRTCRTCDASFKSPVETATCHDCKSKEQQYLTYLRRGKTRLTSSAMARLEAWYMERMKEGKLVPSAIRKRHT